MPIRRSTGFSSARISIDIVEDPPTWGHGAGKTCTTFKALHPKHLSPRLQW